MSGHIRRKFPPVAVNWRDTLPVHPAANLFPLMGADELRELAEDIKHHGPRIPVSIQDGKLLDGRNRLDAMDRAGMQVVKDGALNRSVVHAETIDGNVDPYAFVLSANIHRRHLAAGQRRDLIARVLKAKPETSNRQIAKQMKVDHKTVAAVRAEGEARGEIPRVKATIDTKGRKQPAKSRGMTQKRKLGIFDRTISSLHSHCELTEDTLNDVMPCLSAQQKAAAKRQLTDAIAILQKCLMRVAQAKAA